MGRKERPEIIALFPQIFLPFMKVGIRYLVIDVILLLEKVVIHPLVKVIIFSFLFSLFQKQENKNSRKRELSLS